MPQHEPGPAGGAAVRLAVMAAVAGRLVFAEAGRALPEAAHGRALAVVRHPLDHRVPWAAVGARDEGIAKAAIHRVLHLTHARVARRDVGCDRLALLRRIGARNYRER